MARLFGKSEGVFRASAARFLTAVVVAVSASAFVLAAAVLPASAATAPTTGLTGTALGSGLLMNLFGTKLSGGTSSSCVNDNGASGVTSVVNKNADGSASLCDGQPGVQAASEGEGTLLTSSVAQADQKASENVAGRTDGSTSPTCAQGGATPSGIPFTVTFGVACSYAQAAMDSNGRPSSSAMGEVSNITVGLNGILSPILGAAPSLPSLPSTPLTGGSSNSSCSSTGSTGVLLNTVCKALSTVASAAPPASNLLSGINQALQNLFNVVTTDADPTISIDVGQSKASSVATASGIQSLAQGSSLDIAILPGVGCAAPAGVSVQPTLADCVADVASAHPQDSAPLVDIQVAPSQSASGFDGSKWSPTGVASLVTVDINIPGAQQVISVPPNVDQTILSGTPLQTTISRGTVQTNSTTTGATSLVQGTVVNLLESASFPGGSANVGALAVNTGAIGTTGTLADTPAPAVTASSSTPSPVPAVASATSPTAVHTGEWWSGSMPLLVGIALLGGGLIGWPRLRRLSIVSRLVSRVHR